MSLDGLHTSNSPMQIDHPKCTIFSKDTIVLDFIFRNYFKGLLFEDVICENCSSGSSESIEFTFTMYRNLKEPPSGLKILLQRGTHDMTTGEATKNELKFAIPLDFFTRYHQVMIR